MLTKLQSLWATIKSELAKIWDSARGWIIAFAAIFIVIEFQKIKAYFLTQAAKNEIKEDNKADVSLAKTETSENDQANALVQEANDLPASQPPVTDDWNTK